VVKERALPAPLIRILRRVHVLFGEEPPRSRARCRSLRAFVEAFSPLRRRERAPTAWVGTREMICVFCGGFEDA
jgi:hypothetical protein